MAINCTEDEFKRVIEDIQKYLKNHSHYCIFSIYDDCDKRDMYLEDINEGTRSMGWQSLYDELEIGLSPDINRTAEHLKEEFSPRQLEKLKSLL